MKKNHETFLKPQHCHVFQDFFCFLSFFLGAFIFYYYYFSIIPLIFFFELFLGAFIRV